MYQYLHQSAGCCREREGNEITCFISYRSGAPPTEEEAWSDFHTFASLPSTVACLV